jgi:hypothetical protein
LPFFRLPGGAGQLPVPGQGSPSVVIGVEGLDPGELIELVTESLEFEVTRLEAREGFLPALVELRPRPFGGLPSPVVSGPGFTTCRVT